MQSIKAAVTRETYSGDVLNADEAISVEEAIKGYTIWAAEQFKMADRFGSLTKGKVADLLIVDRNPLEIPANELDQVKIVKTMIAGEVTYAA